MKSVKKKKLGWHWSKLNNSILLWLVWSHGSQVKRKSAGCQVVKLQQSVITNKSLNTIVQLYYIMKLISTVKMWIVQDCMDCFNFKLPRFKACWKRKNNSVNCNNSICGFSAGLIINKSAWRNQCYEIKCSW